jgi:iron complex transport system substrate-binding protein
VLLRCGAPMPDLAGDLADAPVVITPLRSIFSASTTHNPMFDALGVVDRVTGVANLDFTANEAILDAAAAGQLIEFATTGAIDVELVIDAGPDIFMTGGGDDTAYPLLRDAGIRVIANAEWLEPTLLGRAEWIKYVALFFDAEALAADVFDDIERSYLDATAAIAGIAPEDRPLVLAGSPFQGVFYAPGGRSFTAQTIADAGGRYIFADNDETPSLAFPDLEPVLDAAAEASFWINAATGYRTLADIEADEPRLAALPAVQAGQVWNYDLLTSDSGGVGFFELGVLRPDLVLRDLIEIFHPGTLTGHAFTFYRQVTGN